MKKSKISKPKKLIIQYEAKSAESETLITRTYEGQAYDILLHATLAKFTNWLSPTSLRLALLDWFTHYLMSPAKQINLLEKASKDFIQLALDVAIYSGLVTGLQTSELHSRKSDHRFKDPEWNGFPFNLYVQTFLCAENWWNEATSCIRGVSKHHEDVIKFSARQFLDMLAPSNFPWTNPEVIRTTMEEGGNNYIKGYKNLIDDCYRVQNNLPPEGTEKFKVGEDVAITPGKVIYRNHLIELIQYSPVTEKVYAEPILIIPAWIMKYYILDLSPKNSLVKYFVKQGHTVFMISWRNPDRNDRNLGLEDYLNLGIMSSINTINMIIPEKKVHAVGYCLGGTLLAIAASAMAGIGDDRLKSITLFAAQVDFRDAGELSLFIDESQVDFLEDAMWEKGYLDGTQMLWSFSMLRSYDLIWSRMVHDYLLGKRRPMNDLIAWDNDTTRLPYKMHSEYLHDIFLKNNIVQGRFEINKKRIALSDIQIPLFVVATMKDHVSPWRSVYKIQLFTNTDFTFVLTNGGHNAGIVSEPGHPGRNYHMHTRKEKDKHLSSSAFLDKAKQYKGSWWPAWHTWLGDLSEGKKASPSMGNPEEDVIPLCDAPGTYVLMK